MRRWISTLLAAAGTVLLPAWAPAQTADPAQAWSGRVTVYSWLSSITGEQGNRRTVDVDLDAHDILESLEFAFMASGEVRRDRLGFLFDVVYSDLGSGGDVAGTRLRASVDSTTLMLTAAASWRFHDENGAFAEVYGGLRYTDMDVDITVSRDRSVSASTGADWVDPLIGLRGSMPLNDSFSVTGFADVGGFGVGSDLTWEVYGAVSYAFNDRWSANLGYRYMSIDYQGSGLKSDLVMQGPMLGISYAF